MTDANFETIKPIANMNIWLDPQKKGKKKDQNDRKSETASKNDSQSQDKNDTTDQTNSHRIDFKA